MEGGDEEIEDMGEEEGEILEAPSQPQLQTPLSGELDIMPYTPPQVKGSYNRGIALLIKYKA